MELFNQAEQHFHHKEFAEILEIYNSLPDSACDSDEFAEPCVHSHILRANIYRNTGEENLYSQHVAEASHLITLYNLQEHPFQLLLYIQQSVFERESARPDSAKKIISKADLIAENFSQERDAVPLARLEMEKGLLNDTEGYFEDAIVNYKKVLSLLEGRQRTTEIINILAQAHINMGISYRRLGQLETAIRHYETNMDMIREVFGNNHLEMAYAYNGMGVVFYVEGDYSTAGDYFLQAASIFGANLGRLSPRRAAALNNAGISYFRIHDADKAFTLFEQAQEIKELTLGEEHPETAVGYSNLAYYYFQDGDYNQALTYSQRSIDIRKAIYGDTHPDLISPIIRHGQFLQELNDFSQARKQYDTALQIIYASLGENHPDVWDIFIKKGHSYRHENKFYMASGRYLNAVKKILGEPDFTPSHTMNLDTVTHPFILLEALKQAASSELSLYLMNRNSKHLYRANNLLNHTLETADLLQFSYRSEASKLNLVESNYEIYSNAIQVSKLLYEETGDAAWLDNLFTISETARARIALELLQESEAKTFAGVPPDVLEQETLYNNKITEFYQKISDETEQETPETAALTAQYQDSLFYYRNQLHELARLLEDQFPVYHELKHSKTLIDRAGAQHLLEGRTIVNYIFGKNELFVLILQGNETGIHTLPLPENLPERIHQFRQYVLDNDKASYIREGYSLYQALVQPVEPFISNTSVTFVADQALHYLPFEMLVTENNPELRFHELPYLIKKYRIGYAPSVTVMDFMERSRPASPRNFLAFAPFHKVNSGDFQISAIGSMKPLPLTGYETREISALFTQKRGLRDYFFPETHSVYLDEKASKAALLQANLAGYSFLHFATHAYVNEANPALSGIVLRENDAAAALYVNDIYNLNLNADLVVLGACDTGLGHVYRGEGIIGFARAFIYAGTSNLVVSMWPVNDQPTAFLMIDFYKHFREGMPYSQALQMAKLNLIARPEFAAPRNWAAFILYGN